MKLRNNKKPQRPPIKSGTYYGICVHSIDIGDQKDTFSQNGDYKQQFMWVFEIFRLENFKIVPVTYLDEGIEKPYDLALTMNSSQNLNSNVAKHLKSWMEGVKIDEDFMRTFDTDNVVGFPAELKVVLKDNGYNDISAIYPLPEGFVLPEHKLPLIKFNTEPWIQSAFESLPRQFQARIVKSTQYQKEHAPDTKVEVKQEECPI